MANPCDVIYNGIRVTKDKFIHGLMDHLNLTPDEIVTNQKYLRSIKYEHPLLKPEENAIQERSPAEVLQREPGTTGEQGSKRGRMEPGKQGKKPAGENTQSPEKPAPEPVPKEKIKAKEELAAELKKTGLSDDEKFILKNSYPEYKKKNPEATQDEYNVKKADAYKKQVALRSTGMAKLGEMGEGTKPFTNTQEAVDFVKTHLAEDPMAQRVMRLVEPVLKDTKIEAADFSSGKHNGHDINPNALGYSFPDKSIIINWDAHTSPEHAATTLLHEIVHNATREAINSNKAFRGELDGVLEGIRRDLKLPEGSVGDAIIPRLVEKGIIDADKYGGSNSHELIAEVFTNKKFQDMLRGIEYKGDNLLRKAYLAIAKYFSEIYKALVGTKASISVDNMADYLMQLTEKTITGKEKGVAGEGEPLAKVDAGSEGERQLKQLISKHADDLDDQDIKDAFVSSGHDPADVDRLISEVRSERDKGPEQLIREAHTLGEAAKKAAKLAPSQDTRIAKASVMKTAKRWFYDKQDEVTDVKSVIRTNKGKEEHELDMIYKASNKARDFWNTVPKEKREAFILGMERPDLQKSWTQDEKDMAIVYRERLQKTFDVIKTAMPDLNFIEDYFPHFWKKPDEVKNFFASAAAKAPLEGSKGFAMKRSFDNVLPGIQKGYELTTTNPEELVRLAEANAWKFKTARSIFDDMKKLGYLKFSTAHDLPADWKGVEDKLFNRMGAYVTKEGDAQVAKGQYMMPPEVAKLMNDYLSVSGVNAPIKNVVQKYNNIKNTFQLGMGGFHFVTTSVESLINGNTTAIQKLSTFKPAVMASGIMDALSTATILPNIYQRVSRGLRARSDYYKGIETADVLNLIAVNAKVGRQKMYSLDTWYNTKKAFNAIKVDKDFSQIPKFLWNGILAIPEAINKPLMEHWVPALKVGGYLKSLDSEIMSRGNMNPRELQQAREKIWDSMDDRLGQVVYDNVFINKTAKDLAFMTIRSAGWTGGTIRTAFKGIGEIPLSASRVIKGKGLSQRTADLASMGLTVGFFGGMFHYVMTGTPPEEMKDYFFPKDGTKNPDGTDRRITLPSYMKDYLAYGKEPLTTLSHKTSPIVNDLVELWSNKDFYGEKIFNKEDPIYLQGIDVLKHQAESMMPFSFKENPKDIPRNAQQKVEQGFGLMEAPKERERSETQNAIMKAYVDQMGGMAGQAKTHEQMEQYIARRHARQYIFNSAEWDDLDDYLKEKANVSDIQKFVKKSKLDPYEFYFKSLKKGVRQVVFDAMPEDDQEKYKKYIQP